MSLADKIKRSIFNMGVQRVIELVSLLVVTAIVVRALTREEYGVLSVVLSYGLVYNIFNVGISSILLKNYSEVKEQIKEYMDSFVLFSLLKAIAVIIISIPIGILLYARYGWWPSVPVLIANSIGTILLFLAEPYVSLMAVEFRQTATTKFNIVYALANIALSMVVLFVPSALVVSIKNSLIAVLNLMLPLLYVLRYLSYRPALGGKKEVALIGTCLKTFSLWAHIIGLMTDLIYRADLLILGWLNPALSVIGNYNISLQMSNFTKILPQILQYNATLGLSNCQNDRTKMQSYTFVFIKYSFILSVVTFISYLCLGKIVIQIIAGRDVDEIFMLGAYIIAGLCIYNTFRPLISYGTIVGDLKECLYYAIAPSAICTLSAYGLMGYLWGAKGLALANVAGGILMTLFTLVYIHKKTDFKWEFVLVHDFERNAIHKIWGKLKKGRVEDNSQ